MTCTYRCYECIHRDVIGLENEACRDASWEDGDESMIQDGCSYCGKITATGPLCKLVWFKAIVNSLKLIV